MIVKEKPYKAGIDPYNKLIDRVATDNVKVVSVRSKQIKQLWQWL